MEKIELKIELNGIEEITGTLKRMSALIDELNALMQDLGRCRIDCCVQQQNAD